MHWQNHENKKSIQTPKHHHDFSYHDTWNNRKIGLPSNHQPHFKQYNSQDFRDYFTSREYTESQILDQSCLYMFDEFVELAQAYPGYENSIRQMYAMLKNFSCLQKAYYIAKGTYCTGLQKRIQSLYNKLSTIKSEIFSQQKSEYEALQVTYQTYMPHLSKALKKRFNAYNAMASGDCTLRHTNKSYNLDNSTQQLLYKYHCDQSRFTKCSNHPFTRNLWIFLSILVLCLITLFYMIIKKR
jgi:hypothetical protein